MGKDEDRITRAGYAPTPNDDAWERSVGEAILLLEPAREDGSEWWLHLVCEIEIPRMTFAGSLRACLEVDRKVVKLLEERRLA